MANEGRGHAIAGIHGWLHRKQAENSLGTLANAPRTVFAPGPDRGADVMGGTQSGTFQTAFQTQVKVGSIDTDNQIRMRIKQAPDKCFA